MSAGKQVYDITCLWPCLCFIAKSLSTLLQSVKKFSRNIMTYQSQIILTRIRGSVADNCGF
jgi:hypothetical protein